MEENVMVKVESVWLPEDNILTEADVKEELSDCCSEACEEVLKCDVKMEGSYIQNDSCAQYSASDRLMNEVEEELPDEKSSLLECDPTVQLERAMDEETFEFLGAQVVESDLEKETGIEVVDKEMSEGEPVQAKWCTKATKLLLSVYSELAPKVGKTFHLKSKKRMWQTIAEKMLEEGYLFSCTQVENRYKTLIRGYKEKNSNNKRTARSRASCEYESELNEINVKRRAVFPEFLLGAEGSVKSDVQLRAEVGLSLNRVDSPVTVDTFASPSPSSSASAISSSPSEGHGRESRSAVEEMSKFIHLKDKEIELRRMELDLKREMLKAYKERTQEVKKRNDLFSQFLLSQQSNDS